MREEIGGVIAKYLCIADIMKKQRRKSDTFETYIWHPAGGEIAKKTQNTGA